MKTEFILLLHAKYTPQPQKQISPQSKWLGNFFFQLNKPKKQEGVAILISNKIDFKLKSIKKDEERHFVFLRHA